MTRPWFHPDPENKYSKVEFDVEQYQVTTADEVAIRNGCWFDERAAKRVIAFFEKYLRHTKGRWAGKIFTLLPWQKYQFIGPLFGWRRKDGTRRFRKAYVEIPKKNGKSALSSGIALYLLCADGEPGAEVYTAAADRDQADIVFGESEKMVRKSPSLRRRLKTISSRKTIFYPGTVSVYRALSADVPTKEGLNISGLIFDELHAQKTRDLWDTLHWGGAAREQPLSVSITTAGFDRQSICWEQHEYARKVALGIVEDDSFFALIYSTNWEDAESRVGDEEEVDWTSPEAWRMANPSLGHTIKEDDFARDCLEAQESPRKINSFKRYRLNIWTRAEARWFSPEKWKACGGDLDAEELKDRRCWGGLDLSSTGDLTSFSLVFEPDEDGLTPVLNWNWCPKENLWARVKKDRVPYDLWLKTEHLTATPGNVVDYEFILAKILEIRDEFSGFQGLGFDRWGSTQVTVKLEDAGIAVTPVGQGYASMSAPSKELERLVTGELLHHGDNPVLSWAADNVVTISDPAGNIKPAKDKSTEKIDPIVATIIALAAQGELSEDTTSVYESRGVLAI